ncbi:MAG: GGDEF domain-containing protein [Actinomycetia bacterium]|nr:GGDEF domain-containing protein [Actinomycetes bacterium]
MGVDTGKVLRRFSSGLLAVVLISVLFVASPPAGADEAAEARQLLLAERELVGEFLRTPAGQLAQRLREHEELGDVGRDWLTSNSDSGLPVLASLLLAEDWPVTAVADEDERIRWLVIYDTAISMIDSGTTATEALELPGGGGASSLGPTVSVVWLLVIVGICIALAAGVLFFRRRAVRLATLALLDPLTGLANRRQLDRDLENLERERIRARAPVTAVMIDVDKFKLVNDTKGHAEGDRILQVVARVITSSVREGDVVYRYGGEEFFVLLRFTDKGTGLVVAERIRKSVEGCGEEVTISLGVATGVDESVAVLATAADEALLRAKEEGRNRVVVTVVDNPHAARVSDL